jgi:hypothetical protein
MGQAQSYKDLEIYQLAHRLAVEVHQVSLNLPKFEAYEEASQLRRAAKSVSANIVEGFGRRATKANLFAFSPMLTPHVVKRLNIWKFLPKPALWQPTKVRGCSRTTIFSDAKSIASFNPSFNNI